MSKQKVIINICTYQRPIMLRTCIDSILSQKTPEEWQVEILVIDNDAARSAANILEYQSDTRHMPIHYICENQQGIPNARNAGCTKSLAQEAKWIAFIDDDETAEDGWLMAFYEATKTYPADAYSGPVRYLFPSDYAEWLGNKGDLNTKDGTVKKRASTNNALVSAFVLASNGYNLQFDTQMTFTGGSDTDFFMRYAHVGGKIIHVSNAIVAEEVIANRLSIMWRLKRQYRSSTNRVYVNKKLMGIKTAITTALKESIRHLFDGILGLIVCPLYLAKGKNRFKRQYYHGVRHLSKAAGSLAGIFDIHPEPYKIIDGH